MTNRIRRLVHISSRCVLALGLSLAVAAPANAATKRVTTKKVCKVKNGKKVCRIVKVAVPKVTSKPTDSKAPTDSKPPTDSKVPGVADSKPPVAAPTTKAPTTTKPTTDSKPA